MKHFPPNATSSTILFLVYTTSPLLSFEVSGVTSHKSSAELFASFVSSSPYEIIWQHSVIVARLDYAMNGEYHVKITNEDGERAVQKFSILKAKC